MVQKLASEMATSHGFTCDRLALDGVSSFSVWLVNLLTKSRLPLQKLTPTLEADHSGSSNLRLVVHI